MFPSLVSATDGEIPHERGQINLACLAYQGHTNTCELMYAFLITPPHTHTHSPKFKWNRAVGLLLWGWCVIMDLSGVVLSPPKDTDTADIRIVHIFITLAERTHAPAPLLLIYFNRPVNYCTIIHLNRFRNDVLSSFSNSSFLGLLVIQTVVLKLTN